MNIESKPVIIGLVGPVRSGKTTAAKYLQEAYGYVYASNSDILFRILNKFDMVPSRENMGRLGDAIFSELGNEAIARYRVASSGGENVVIDGIRYKEEVRFYRDNSDFTLMAIISEDENRYDRVLGEGKGGKDGFLCREEFKALAEARSEVDVPDIIRGADVVIENNHNLKNFYNKIDHVLKV